LANQKYFQVKEKFGLIFRKIFSFYFEGKTLFKIMKNLKISCYLLIILNLILKLLIAIYFVLIFFLISALRICFDLIFISALILIFLLLLDFFLFVFN